MRYYSTVFSGFRQCRTQHLAPKTRTREAADLDVSTLISSIHYSQDTGGQCPSMSLLVPPQPLSSSVKPLHFLDQHHQR